MTIKAAGARLRVDPIACDGRGLCAEMLPELITLDDWGFPIISDQDMPDRLKADARETVRACPKLALRLVRPRQRPGSSVREQLFPALARALSRSS